MNSLVVDLILCGLAYVILIYFVATMTKTSIRRGNNRNDDGDGGIDNIVPPKIDLPPGVVWPADAPIKIKFPEPVEF
jgi:hypothetical protein